MKHALLALLILSSCTYAPPQRFHLAHPSPDAKCPGNAKDNNEKHRFATFELQLAVEQLASDNIALGDCNGLSDSTRRANVLADKMYHENRLKLLNRWLQSYEAMKERERQLKQLGCKP